MKLALQLFSLRNECAADLPGTLKKVAEMGYEGVEFFGNTGYGAEELSQMLKDARLEICGWHVGVDVFEEDAFEKTVSFHNRLGNTRLVVPGLPEHMTNSIKAWHETARYFNDLSKRLAPYGFCTGYHNHATEFQALDGEMPWDVIIGETYDKVIAQLDNGNAMSGGADSLAVLKAYPGRARTCHLKPYSLQDGFETMVGEDDVPWAEFLAELKKQNTTEWAIIEYEAEKYKPLEACALCLNELRKSGY